MEKSQMRLFAEAGIVAAAQLVGQNDFLEVDDSGLLVIPEGVRPEGFHLLVAVEKNSRTFVVQKNVGTEGGGYESRALSEFEGCIKGFRTTVMFEPIDVIRAGTNVWTGWHKNQASNRVDCWYLGVDGQLDLFQIGVLTHDNGKTFRLHGEYRWRGQLYKPNDELVGFPESPKWGSLDGGTSHRKQIFSHPGFIALMEDVNLLKWAWKESDVNPPLPEVPGKGFAVVDWYISFAGQTGQGIAKNKNGDSAWVHGADIEGFDPNSSEPLLWHGDIVSFQDVVQNWGAKKNGPPKLTGVKLVKRSW